MYVCMHVCCVSVCMGKGRTGREGGSREAKLKYFSARFFVYSLNFLMKLFEICIPISILFLFRK